MTERNLTMLVDFYELTMGNGFRMKHYGIKHSAYAVLPMSLTGESMYSVTRLRRTAITKEST